MKVAYDCVVVGGSYGGLSAALALGRSLRQTLVIDEGLPCNRFTPHSQNFLTRDGFAPAEIAAIGKQQIQDKYKTVSFQQDRVASIAKKQGGEQGEESPYRFDVTTDSGDTFQSKALIFATGVKDIFPENVPGFVECWGTSVIHCPYCHGYEFHSQPTALFMSGPAAMHMAPLIRNLTPTLQVLSQDAFSEEEQQLLQKNDIELVDKAVKEILHKDGHITEVLLEDGTSLALNAMYAGIPFELNAKKLLQDDLGCDINDDGYLVVDGMQKTSVDGVFGVGDATTMFRSVANAVQGGNIAGAVVNMELSNAEFAN